MKIRSRSHNCNKTFSIPKCCIHAKFLYGQVIRSGDIGFNIIFWPKISLLSTAVTLKIRSRSQNCNQIFSMSKCCIHVKFLYGKVIRSGDIGLNIIFWPKISLFSTAVTLKIRSRSQNCNQILSMSKFCIHVNFLYGQVIRSGDIGFNIIIWPKITLFSTAVTLKIRSRSQICNKIFSMFKYSIHVKFLYGQVIRSGDIGFNIIFWPKISLFSTAVTLKIRSRSQNCNQVFSMSKGYILANFD